MQFPGESAPADVYGGEWINISSQFAGMFFRAEGGNAATFGEPQNDGAPNITGTFMIGKVNQTPELTGAFYQTASGSSTGDGSQSSGRTYGFSAYNSHNKYSLNEFRPYNSAIRIWRKTA